MPEFPKKYKSRQFKVGGPTGEIVTKMILEDGTVLGPDAKPISGPQTETKEEPKPKPEKKARKTVGFGKAAKAAARLETPDGEEV